MHSLEGYCGWVMNAIFVGLLLMFPGRGRYIWVKHMDRQTAETEATITGQVEDQS